MDEASDVDVKAFGEFWKKVRNGEVAGKFVALPN